LADAQRARLGDEAGIRHNEIKATARALLAGDGVDLDGLRQDPRLRFLF
jgi:hypothetical protein